MPRIINNISHLKSGMIGVLGMPFDSNSSFRRGPSLAPARIREGFYSASGNLWTETGQNLETVENLVDLGDMDIPDDDSTVTGIEKAVSDVLNHGARLVSLGGDHSITYPIIRAYAAHYPDLNLLQMDAHPDLYDSLDGNRLSHACPFARIMEEKPAVRLVQIGIRTMNGHQQEQARRFGVTVHDMIHQDIWKTPFVFDGPVYLSLDLDCLDPAFAPGVSHHEPGGMTTREVLQVIQQLKGRLVGADIVEYNPDRDHLSVTAMVAAKFLKEIIGRMLD